MNKKVLIGGLAGGVAYFFIGFLIYGTLLTDFISTHTNNCANRPMEDMVWWSLILSNLVTGLLLSLVLDWSGANDWMGAFKNATLVGLLTAIGMNLSFYSMTTMFHSAMAMVVDAAALTVMYALVGAVIGFVFSKLK